MIKTVTSLLVPGLIALGLQIAPAHAQSSRTYVSAANGNDSNDCSRPTPCRTFQAAHDKTNPDGEVTVLDPGGYGGLTITKSISIVNDGGGEASILVSGGATGITINAGPASYVNLRGITIQGINFGGGIGLDFHSGFALTMTNCVVRNHTEVGILFRPSGSSNLAMSNTLVADNGHYGIDIRPVGTGITVKAVLSRIQLYNNSIAGLRVSGRDSTGKLKATVTDSVAAGSGADGFLAVADAVGTAVTTLMVVRSVAANNFYGLEAFGANATLRFNRTTATGNFLGWIANAAGVVRSYGDNNIDGNGAVAPAPPTIAKK